MTSLKWTNAALNDLSRLYEFLAAKNHKVATKTIQSLTSAPQKIIAQPRIGAQLDEFTSREVRRLLIGHYEMRYELRPEAIYILRIWHTRESR